MFANLPINEIEDGSVSLDLCEAEVDRILKQCWWFEYKWELYIVDKENEDIYGPDDKYSDTIYVTAMNYNSAWSAAEFLGVDYIPVPLRRFSFEDGFYHA